MSNFLKYAFALLLLVSACKSETKSMKENSKEQSIDLAQKEISVDKLAGELKQKLVEKGFTIMADIDHAASAAKVGLALRPTRTLIFGNPKGGTLLMQQAQEIAIDLPLKLAIWEDEYKKVHASYYNGTALTARYGINEPGAFITKIDGMFKGVTGSYGQAILQEEKDLKDQIITKSTALTVDETFVKLKQIVSDKGLQIMAEINHDQGAGKVGLELRPTRVLVFGNPKVGTLLMQSNQEMALDLPLKIAIYQNEKGETEVSYYDATFLAKRYGITNKNEVVNKVNAALDGITNATVTSK